MARDPTSSDEPPATTRGPRPSSPPDLPLFQFGLRQLFGLIAVVSVLLAGMVVADGITALVLLLAALVVAAHIAGTTLGSRLRSHANRRQAMGSGAGGKWAGAEGSGPLTVPRAKLPTPSSMSRSSWHRRGGAESRWHGKLIASGAVVGGVGGAILLALTIGHRTSLIGLAIGAVSLGVLGGWFAFLASSFYVIFRHGWREAVADQKGEKPGPG